MFITLLGWALIGLILSAAVEYVALKVKPTLILAITKYLIGLIVVFIVSYILGQLLKVNPDENAPKAPLFAKIVMLGVGAVGIMAGRWISNLIKDRSA